MSFKPTLRRWAAILIGVGVCLGPFHATAGLLISEFMAANSGGIFYLDGDSLDWIEIHKDLIPPTSLAGRHLKDNAGNLSGWAFPPPKPPPGGYFDVFPFR